MSKMTLGVKWSQVQILNQNAMHIRSRAHIVPTICPQLHISPVIPSDVFMQVNVDPVP